jgi:multiple sugar transport system ATP-binding protein
LFDEPLSTLDAKLRVTMRAELSTLQRRLETTMIYVTHDQVEAMTMGDRIVIMKDGFIQQVGKPLEVYDYPQNEFVAGFIGSPPMNFFRAKVVQDQGALHIDTGDFRVKIPPQYGQFYDKYVNRDVTFGIRPEDVADEVPAERRGQWEKFTAKVEVIEPLGAEIILELNKGKSFTARVNPHSKAKLDQDIEVSFDMLKMHLFDSETQKVIARGEFDHSK